MTDKTKLSSFTGGLILHLILFVVESFEKPLPCCVVRVLKTKENCQKAYILSIAYPTGDCRKLSRGYKAANSLFFPLHYFDINVVRRNSQTTQRPVKRNNVYELLMPWWRIKSLRHREDKLFPIALFKERL